MCRATARPTSWGLAALLVFWVAQLAFAVAAGEVSNRPVAASFAIGSRMLIPLSHRREKSR
eukprot:4701316-Prorocentrum_lima.AAC.1